jgi:hypothetical protein
MLTNENSCERSGLGLFTVHAAKGTIKPNEFEENHSGIPARYQRARFSFREDGVRGHQSHPVAFAI